MVERKKCVHCGEHYANRPRGLCWKHYYAPGVRDLYPSTSKFARRGVADRTGSQPAAAPTSALPGTPEKLAALAERARLGQELFSSGDPAITYRASERRRASLRVRLSDFVDDTDDNFD